LTIASVGLLLFAVATAATGQVMLKHGMQIATARAHDSGGSLALRAATSPWVLLGLVVFGVSAIAWLAALSKVPLSVAYPFNALGYLVILIASILVLHERANVMTWVGSLLVVSGLLIVVLTKPLQALARLRNGARPAGKRGRRRPGHVLSPPAMAGPAEPG
jgi:multidrug transporter EmrE-like cation transporter